MSRCVAGLRPGADTGFRRPTPAGGAGREAGADHPGGRRRSRRRRRDGGTPLGDAEAEDYASRLGLLVEESPGRGLSVDTTAIGSVTGETTDPPVFPAHPLRTVLARDDEDGAPDPGPDARGRPLTRQTRDGTLDPGRGDFLSPPPQPG